MVEVRRLLLSPNDKNIKGGKALAIVKAREGQNVHSLTLARGEAVSIFQTCDLYVTMEHPYYCANISMITTSDLNTKKGRHGKV